MLNKFLMSKYWLDWIFPNKCPICNKVIIWNELICYSCIKALPVRDNLFVTDKLQQLDFVCALFNYEGKAVDAIYALKNNKGINFAEYSSKILAEFIIENQIAEKIDLITCVPMTKKKQIKRGYNQAEIIAEYIGKNLGKTCNFKLLLHNKNKTEQHKLNSQQRLTNAYDNFTIKPNHADLHGKNILICDDVITTGATMKRCTELLKSMGADKVFACSICTTVYKNHNDM